MGRIRVGLSGWNYDAWRGDFYPADLPKTRHLAYAADRMGSIEVNGTFYGLVSAKTFRSWRDTVPRGMPLAIKGSRFITHNKKLRDVDSALANFFAQGVLELDDRLGPLLWQLSPNLHQDLSRLEAFLDLLPHDTDAAAALARRHDDRITEPAFGPGTTHRLRHVLEVRHESWLTEDLVRLVRDHGVALAFSHAATFPYVEEVTAGFVYVRLHGPEEVYGSAYGEARLRRWADRIRRWHAGEEPDDARRITDRVPPRRKERDVYVYFDNDMGGHAPREAVALQEILAEG